VWWSTPVITTPGRLRQEDLEFWPSFVLSQKKKKKEKRKQQDKTKTLKTKNP
jgi:hypothetical protein